MPMMVPQAIHDAASRVPLGPAKARAEANGAARIKGMPLEPVVNLLALGGVVYVATVANVYRVEGDRLVRLHWPRGPQRRRKEV